MKQILQSLGSGAPELHEGGPDPPGAGAPGAGARSRPYGPTTTTRPCRTPSSGTWRSRIRSHDWRMPEEVNRVLTDRLSDLLLTPSRDARSNLHAEGIENGRRVGRQVEELLICFRIPRHRSSLQRGSSVARWIHGRRRYLSRSYPAVSKWWSKAKAVVRRRRRMISKLTASVRVKRWSRKRSIHRAWASRTSSAVASCHS
jgi:hypothetical protein